MTIYPLTINKYAWNSAWIRPTESYWSLINKFCYANELNCRRFNKLMDQDIERERINKTLGFTSSNYTKKQEQMIYSKIGNSINGIDTIITDNIWYCPKCRRQGFHSIYHQVSIFKYCPFHRNERLICMSSASLNVYDNNNNYQYIDYPPEIPVKNIYNSWRNKSSINSREFRIFNSIPSRFVYNNDMDSNLNIETNCSDRQLIDENGNLSITSTNPFYTDGIEFAVKLNLPNFAKDPNYQMDWWGRQENMERINKLRIHRGGLIKRSNQTRFLKLDNVKTGSALIDISESLRRYVLRLFNIQHKKCIRIGNYSYQIKNGTSKSKCMISDFYYKLKTNQSVMNTNYRLMRPSILCNRKSFLRRSTLNDFSKYSRYSYDTFYKMYNKPLNHLSDVIESTDVFAFHIYMESFCRLIQQLMKEWGIKQFEDYAESRIVFTKETVFFYPSFSIEDQINTVIDFCDKNSLCN